ncbi:MAG: hypothetical protein SOS24_05285 [Clostridia bacterium]|nr:hypothetical protein [Clostridia bacterium]
MNKKLISALLSASMLFGSAVFAAAPISGELSDGVITFSGVKDGVFVINGYNDEGKLSYSQNFTAKDGVFTVPGDVLKYDLTAYSVKDKEVVQVAVGTTAQPTETPAPIETPAPTPSTPTPSPAPYDPNKFPAVYENAANAIYAFAVIDKVSTEMDNSEEGYRVDYYYQGTKHSDWIGNDIEIVTAPDSAQSLKGAKLTSLKRGDVVFLNRRMDGSIKEIAAIYQAQSKDIVNNTEDFGPNFQKLFSVQGKAVAGYSGWGVQSYGQPIASKGTQYAFGVIGRRENTVIYLLNKTGKINSAINLPLADDAMVYICNMQNTQGITVSKPSGIAASIPNVMWNKALEDSDPTITFDKSGYNYALARIVDGTVMDIVVYSNY